MQRRLAAILVADVAGYSKLMGSDEAGTLRRLKEIRQTQIDPLLAARGGRIIKLMGDGAIVEFASVVDAVDCAVLVQESMARGDVGVVAGQRLRFRIAVHLGDLMVDGDDVYGDGVNVAARLEALADPGGVVVSETVREHIGMRLDLMFEDLGLHELKNIDRPVKVHKVTRPAGRVDGVRGAQGGDPAKPSVAVLPFANMSGDPEQEYFSDGITEDLITDLSKISGLYVTARNSTFVYKGKAVDVQEASRKLAVRYILEGSVRKAGTRVRITAQLIDGSTGGHVWADRFDRDLTDIFAVQDEITASIVGALKVHLLPAERDALANQPTGNMEAYQQYLRGRQFFHRHNKRSYSIARQLFEQARALDPTFARAHAAIADCDAFLFLNSEAGVSQEAILTNATRALELEPGLPAAHASLGLALQVAERYEEAEREYATAVQLDPNLFEGHYFFARFLFVEGRMEEAARSFERAAAVHPDDYQAMALLVQVYRSLGRPERAHSSAQEALARAQRELQRSPENARAAYLGALVQVELGQVDAARAWLSRALAIEPDDFLTLYNVACTLSLLGDLDRAVEVLTNALPRAHRENRAWLRSDSDFDPLREHPGFQALLRQLDAMG